MAESSPSPLRILVLNPNSSSAMTDGMAAAIRKLSLPDSIKFDTYTAPASAPASINDQKDIDDSTKAVLGDADLVKDLESSKYDAVLVACFSVHSLVGELGKYKHLAVTGIFEASIVTTLSLNPDPLSNEAWGIVTTGKFWEDHLGDGTKRFLGQNSKDDNSRFAGVFSTGLNASDFHTVPPEQVRAKLVKATKELLTSGNVTAVVMGCGGMAGLEEVIRSTAIDVYGEAGKHVHIIDGVKAGIFVLEQVIHSQRAFR